MAKALAYTRAEAAALLLLSRSTFDRRCREGSIRTVRIGRRVIVPAQEIERLLAGDPSGDPDV